MLGDKESLKEKMLPDMKIVQKAWELEEHTFLITSSDKRFPKKYRLCLCNRIQEVTLDISCYLLEANEINIKDARFRDTREEYQNIVMRKCKLLMHLIELTNRLKIINADSFEYWAKMPNNIKNMCAKWQESDLKRIQHFEGGGL